MIRIATAVFVVAIPSVTMLVCDRPSTNAHDQRVCRDLRALLATGGKPSAARALVAAAKRDAVEASGEMQEALRIGGFFGALREEPSIPAKVRALEFLTTLCKLRDGPRSSDTP